MHRRSCVDDGRRCLGAVTVSRGCSRQESGDYCVLGRERCWRGRELRLLLMSCPYAPRFAMFRARLRPTVYCVLCRGPSSRELADVKRDDDVVTGA